ncbi:hypothetical protein [Flavobacterium sp. N2270]|uniref:hypothetical protein n=1 Tax=Flavobacterium sp. N2270 TaxID=2986831 RepID=UPI002224F3B3|nr:hypothetical protein [Flavobacterium sp. N2270]
MRFIFILTFLCITSSNYSQKNYHFDTVLEYDIKQFTFNNKKDTIDYFLINSKNNSYVLHVNNDSLITKFLFIDQNGNSVIGELNSKDFFKAETINNDCNIVRPFTNPYKKQVENYYYVNLKDTVINTKSYFHYAIKSNKSISYIKRKNIKTYHYIVEKDNSNFLPFLLSSTSYEEWKKEKNIPNGVAYIIYFEDIEGNITTKMTLKNHISIDKYFTIPKNCDYSIIDK